MPNHIATVCITALCVFYTLSPGSAQNVRITVDIRAEEEVYDFVSPDNGSGPLWSFGCSPIARMGSEVIICQMETGIDVPKLCNTRWRLLRRTAEGWTCFAEAEGFRQREPAVLAVLPENRLFLNVNDSIEAPGTMYGRTEPKLLFFAQDSEVSAPVKFFPEWNTSCHFTDHSYRGYAADRERRQLLMFNIDATTSIQHWCLLDEDGDTLGNGEITFPIRACYPHVALSRGSGHMLAISDIVEPIKEWREYKYEQTQRKWDYVFRILYYASTPNILEQDFLPPIEIANVDATGGAISGQDLWVAPDGSAYILYTESEVASVLLRDKFLPGKSIIPSLHFAVVKNNEVIMRRTLIQGNEQTVPVTAKFHVAPSGNVYAFIYQSGAEAGNLLMQVFPFSENGTKIPVAFQKPFTGFLLASVRAGNEPSNSVDIVGHRDSGEKVCYGQFLIKDECLESTP